MPEPEVSGSGSGGGQSPAPSASPNAEDFERVRQERDQFASVLQRLEPYAEVIKPILEDEGYRSYVTEGRRYYDDLQQKKPKDLSPEGQAILDAIEQKTKPFLEQFQRNQTEQQQALNAKRTRAFEEGKPIVTAFLEGHPELRDARTPAGRAFARTLDELQSAAVESDRPFKEVWDNYASAFSGGNIRREAPPRQLRANAGEQGVPAAAERRPAANEKPQSVKDAFMDAFNRVGRKAS